MHKLKFIVNQNVYHSRNNGHDLISLGFTLKLLPIVASPKKTSNAVGSGFNEANTISYFHRLID